MGEPMMHGRGLQKLGSAIAEELDAMRDESAIAGARERLFEQRRVSSPALRGRAPRVIVGFAFAAAAAVAAAAFLGRAPRALSFNVGDSPERGAAGAWIAAPPAAPVTMRFDDGSRFEVGAAGRARVASTARKEPHLVLESGALHGDASELGDAGAWHVTAGPFDAVVRGARFEMSWDPDAGVLEVRNVSGRVVVTGPHAKEGVALDMGDQLRVSLREARLEVSARPRAALSGAPAVSAPSP
jgi:hypothetical protein